MEDSLKNLHCRISELQEKLTMQDISCDLLTPIISSNGNKNVLFPNIYYSKFIRAFFKDDFSR